MRAPRSLLMTAAAATAIIVLTPAAASAFQIDNDTDHSGMAEGGYSAGFEQASFWFDCGISCGNYYDDIESGHSVGRSGVGGLVQAAGEVRDTGNRTLWHRYVCETGTRVSVGTAGIVGLKFTLPDQDTEKEVAFTWTSKGGNNWNGSQTHKSTDYVLNYCWFGTP